MERVTAGTTGRPKAIVHLHHDVIDADRHLTTNLGIQPGDRLFCTSKIFFAYALGNVLLGGLRAGATLILNRGWPDAEHVARVVGPSMGGMIAQVLAARHPRRVISLTSIMSSSGNPQRKLAFGTRRALQALLRPPPPPGDIQAVAEHLLRVFGVIGSPGIPQDPSALRSHFERVARRGLYREGTERQLLAILASGDRRAMLGEVSAPTLVLHGSADPLVPLAAGLDTAAHIPGARMEVIMGMGHDFPDSLMPRLANTIAVHCRAHADPLHAE